jgi:meso-butanediol dehydrogenase/(S,S)-butanediol dehydrogenase/diacetyl reductase
MARLQNKVALITGAASGIGLACAQRYASEGAVVIGTDIQDREDWCSLVGGDPENALYKLDVTDGAAQKAIADDLITRFGRIDILLTAAGVGAGGPINLLDEDAWDRVVDINLKGTFLSIKAVIDQMMAHRQRRRH